MGLSAKLCNSTSEEAIIPWGRGKIRVPGDGMIEVTPEQLKDFRPGQPGSEEVKKLLDYYGCFLMDTDRGYDIQVLEAVDRCLKARESQFKEFLASQRRDLIQAGKSNVTDEDLEGKIEMAGYDRIRDFIESLRARKKVLDQALRDSGEIGTRTAPQYDPERTCFGCTPPREFPTKLALDLFLAEHPAEKASHDQFIANMNAAVTAQGGNHGGSATPTG